MSSALETANPFGRVDVAVYRMAEAAGTRLVPNSWPVIKPAVAELVEKHVPANGLGFLPFVLAFMAGSAIIAGAVKKKEWEYENVEKPALKPPVPAPVPSAPPNPALIESKTRSDAWTPAMQQAQDRLNWDAWRPTAIPAWPDLSNSGTGLPGSQSNTLLWLAIGAGAVGLIFLLRGR